MKSITKKEIVRKMCNTAAWELDECQAFNAVSDIPDGEFRKYGTMHFKTVSYIINYK